MEARYKILEEIGAGGAGAVFKAYDTQLDRYVAVKRLMSKEESDKQDAQSGTLKKEAASLATLQHPNIVSVYDLGNDEQGFFMIMEMVEGETLSDWVKTTPMTLNDFQELATQCLEAVISAHSQSILHRDLKPENIKIKRLPGGRIQVKVLDFGLARMSYGAKKMTEDQSGNVVGSIYYMAPEQFLRKPVDVRTDLYSLGCVFYQALSCRRPYSDNTIQGVMEAHLKHMVHPLKTVAPEVPQTICDWVMWLINADPKHRPPNAVMALASLRDIVTAGWFNESVLAAIPVDIPEGSDQGWRATGTIPRVPSGAISQRITTSQPTSQTPRPTGATPTRGPSTTSSGRVPAPAKRPADADEEEAKLPSWVWPTAAAAVLCAIAWYFFHGKAAPAGKAGVPTLANAPKAIVRPPNLLLGGEVIHYLAGEKMDAWSNTGKQAAAKPNDSIVAWHDLAPIAGDGIMNAPEKDQMACPRFIVEKPGGFNGSICMVRFEPGQAVMHRMDKGDAQCIEYPFAPTGRSKGVTVLMLVRPQIRNAAVRCLRLQNQDRTASLDIRAFPNNDWKLQVKVGSAMKEAKVTGRSVTQYSLVTATWNPTSGKALLSVRGEDGGKGRDEIEPPKNMNSVLNEIRIADYAKEGEGAIAPTDLFSGDIAEIVVWPYPMEWEQRSAQEWKFMQLYFSTPGNQY